MKNGQARVLIENVKPCVDNGLYPVKRVVGERVEVTADIFADGHDLLRAEVLYKKADEKEWNILPMQNTGNDCWVASFYVTQQQPYVFTLRAWVDPLKTWYDGLVKKINAHTLVHLEFEEGAQMLERLAGTDNTKLRNAVKRLRNKSQYTANLNWAKGSELAELVDKYPYRRFEVYWPAEITIVVEPRRALFSTWYELFPRSASFTGGHGTFKDVIRLLPRIEAMGFDVLYLPPIHPIGKINRKGKNNNVRSEPGEPGSPWAVGSDEGGHKSVHPQLGTLEDFRLLITKARARGIDIAMDLAFQCAPDHPYVKDNPQWFKHRPDGSIQYAENPPKKYQDIYPFDFECDDWQNLWNELLSIVQFWIGQGVRIFRVDNPHTKPFRFWQWLISNIHQTHPDIIFLSEAFTRPKIMAALAKLGFTQSYTYFTWRVSKEEIIAYMNELVHTSSRNYFRPNFWPNTPDILPYHLQHQGEAIFIIRLALAATLSSNYGIYGPPYEFCENTPVPGKEEYLNSEKYEIRQYNWKQTNRMTDIITLINRARRQHPALQTTWNIRFCHCENPHLLAYVKYTDDLSDIMFTVVNLDAHNRQWGYVQLPLDLLGIDGNINVKLHDVVADERYTWTQEWNYVELDPHRLPFHLFHLTVHESWA
ncbi:MAG: alpha-1,4-glucan:maltose-1-phosphate maltosyltransferase [Cyclobacteriaceae bacterium]|nr:MAG: alpha-1,4-glucan:maltose-1-phosphate maltosyltransferase [Cyclobacteriaceae bacterium]